MIKGIIFDFWGTLVENGVFPSPVRQVRFMLNLRIPFSEFIVKFEESFMMSEPESLTEAFTNVCKVFNIEPKKEIIENLVGMWNKNMLLAKPYPETIETLERLKKDYKIGLISNTDKFSLEPLLEKFGLDKYFDYTALSYKMTMLKTNPKMFEDVLSNLGISKEEAIMVGDSMETDIKGAINAGVKPILIDRRNVRTYENKIRDLKEIDKFLK
ncbi:MAG: HAD family hydrolase [Candidatus Woesearchaeota archaeon]|jgi:HAD superfamily hydrolase (TIGR01549 family)|nr:HAD family hydrolase [Candidatus Woesearchaeota archaeon]MDP7506435.1 HAD family hydrolase [Candidatus Woesearchaeota archaeon]MDP7610763.1 HAD family hydrolase [Candidatus Woesearchaeota archaeon]|tara:strand:- start:2332 stop:2970 length:639 start_codon:yes stop_codon:yes gene_type:complete